jgi:hypothetical protein
MRRPRLDAFLLAASLALLITGCAVQPPMAAEPATIAEPTGQSVLRSIAMDRDLEDRILALDPSASAKTTFAIRSRKGPRHTSSESTAASFRSIC